MFKKIEKLISASTDPQLRFNLRVLAVKSGINAQTFKGSMEKLLYPSYLTEQGIQFIHVPKAAGTSIASAIYSRVIPHHSAEYYHCVNSSRFRDTLSFAVVRDPIERFKSSFRFLISGGTKTVKVKKSFKYKRFQKKQDINCFVKEWLIKQKTLDFTLMPQSDFVCSKKGDLLVTKIFDLSDIESCSKLISKEVGKDIYIPRINSTNDQSLVNLNEDSIKILKEFYSKDYELLNKHIGYLWHGS
ncbi:MAG: sulfotransferase family 2 domain-containing protein [Porticoccaceae bacterium]